MEIEGMEMKGRTESRHQGDFKRQYKWFLQREILKPFENTWNKEEKNYPKHPVLQTSIGDESEKLHVMWQNKLGANMDIKSNLGPCSVWSCQREDVWDSFPIPHGLLPQKEKSKNYDKWVCASLLITDIQLNLIQDTKSYLQSSE